MRHSVSVPLALLIAIALVSPYSTALAAPAAQREICFADVPGIDSCIAPEFASYWQSNGGLPVFGYPIGPRKLETPAADSPPLYTQWTERNRLEQHPDAPPAYQIQIGRVGAERLAQLGRAPVAPAESGPQDGCLWFAETGHNLCDQADGQGFRSYWEGHGLKVAGLNAYQRSLALFGLPLTAAQIEQSADGQPIITQWFERARFEWHPDNPATFRVLLGLVGNEVRGGEAEAPSTAFGVEINRSWVAPIAWRLSELRASQVRYNGIFWAEVEPNQGERRWENLASVEGELAAISAAGAAPTVIVRNTPTWARQVPASACGPIKPEALADFAAFMGELAARYSQPPYNVHAWELGNEPDADIRLVSGDAPFGCWGDAQQADAGSASYAAMLKAAYPAIKAADPQAEVIIGGLLMDCDPSYAPSQPCPSGSFFEGVLAAGGGDYFDSVAYHSYQYWSPPRIDWDATHLKWGHRGGALLGKLALLREVMERYGVSKPVVMNEGGLLCYHSDPSCGPGGFYTDQANYLVRLYARATAAGISGTIWFTLNGPGWQESGLLDNNQQPRPAYQTYVFMSTLLSGASYVGSGTEGGVERHSFQQGGRTYSIYWTNDGSSVELPLPAGAQTIYSIDGASAPPGVALNVGFVPVIVEALP